MDEDYVCIGLADQTIHQVTALLDRQVAIELMLCAAEVIGIRDLNMFPHVVMEDTFVLYRR
jgi:hypothetical protein